MSHSIFAEIINSIWFYVDQIKAFKTRKEFLRKKRYEEETTNNGIKLFYAFLYLVDELKSLFILFLLLLLLLFFQTFENVCTYALQEKNYTVKMFWNIRYYIIVSSVNTWIGYIFFILKTLLSKRKIIKIKKWKKKKLT